MAFQREHELLDLIRRRQVPAEDRARGQHGRERLERLPRLREIQDRAVEGLAAPRDVADVALAELEPVRRLPEEGLDVPNRPLLELGPQVVGDDPALGTGGPAQRQRERARTRPGLQDAGTREDVRPDQDRAGVLGVDDLGAPRHLQHEVGQPRPERSEGHPRRRMHKGPLGRADQEVVREPAAVRVPGLVGLERDEVPAVPLVHQQDPLPRLERPDHRGTVP